MDRIGGYAVRCWRLGPLDCGVQEFITLDNRHINSVKPRLLVPGLVLSLGGVLLSATFTFAGPRFPDGPVGVFGWVVALAGFALLRAGVD